MKNELHEVIVHCKPNQAHEQLENREIHSLEKDVATLPKGVKEIVSNGDLVDSGWDGEN